VRLVTDDQVTIGLLELGMQAFIPAELVQAADHQVVFLEPVARTSRFQLSQGKYFDTGSSSLTIVGDFVTDPHNAIFDRN